MSAQPVLIAGRWREASYSDTFQAENPATREKLAEMFPVSSWEDCDQALHASVEAAEALRHMDGDRMAKFLERFAEHIESHRDTICETAHQETAYPVSPRLLDVELPRTTSQLRQAAHAAREGSWATPTIDTKLNIRSYFASLGPVCVFGPNNFPLAFGSISGGDFAAAIAAGNPVIAKANSSHPATTQRFAELAQSAAEETQMPTGTVQLLYRVRHEDGERLVSDARVGATGYTGSRSAGLRLKSAAESAGKPIYLELSAINPVIILPRALRERSAQIAEEFTGSCLMGTGQFCTNPGLVLLIAAGETDQFIQDVARRFREAPAGTLLSAGVAKSLAANLDKLQSEGAQLLAGGKPADADRYSYANTLLKIDGARFMKSPTTFQTEAFGNASLFVVAQDADQASAILTQLEGNLTGSIYSDSQGSDDETYNRLAPHLAQRVGRLLNDKMPTGVAVSPAMNHGGPYPATGHPGFTAVGIPASISRFAMLRCYDNVRPDRLPTCLRDKNPNGSMWRSIDGQWTQTDVPSAD